MLIVAAALQFLHIADTYSPVMDYKERLSQRNGVKDDDSGWYWDPAPQTSKVVDRDIENEYTTQIRSLQQELSSLKQRDTVVETNSEVLRLKEENANLMSGLEDLDNQHRVAMEKLYTLKKELQKNFEVLKREHEELKNCNADLKKSNDGYASEVKKLLLDVDERDKEIAGLKSIRSDYDTLQHKYQNLERVHSTLRENTEKFHEENQELHEEIFKLQEKVTKLEHDLEVQKHGDTSNTVPKDKYDELLKECESIRHRKNLNHSLVDEVNIDDNAKGVIETLKRDISDLKHELSQCENEKHNNSDNKIIKADMVTQLYNRYINFELPVDYVGEMPSSNDSNVLHTLENVFKTISTFKHEIDTLENNLTEKNHCINQLQAQIDDITSENDFLTTDLQHYERELDEMKKNNDFLISEIAALKNTSKLEPIIETHEDNYTKLETELDDCTKINKTFEMEIKRIQNELLEVQAEKIKLQDSLSDLKQKYTSMLNELEVCKTKTKAIVELDNSAHFENNDTLRKAFDVIDDLKSRLNTANAKNEQISIDNHIIENDKVLLTKEVDDLKNILEIKSAENKNLLMINSSLSNNIKELENKVVEAANHPDDSKQETQVAFVNNSTSVKSNSRPEEGTMYEDIILRKEIDKLNNTIKSLKDNVIDLSDKNEMLQRNYATKLRELDSLRSAVEDNKNVTDRLEILERDIVKFKEDNKILSEHKQALETQLFSTNKKVSSLEEEIDKLVSDLKEKDVVINTVKDTNLTLNKFKDTINQLETSIASKNIELEALTKKYEEVSNEFHLNNDSLQITQEELKTLQIKKEETDKHFYELSDELLNKNSAIAEMTDRNEKLNRTIKELQSIVENKDKEIKELNHSIGELSERMKTDNKAQLSEENVKLMEEISSLGKITNDLNNQLEEKTKEVSELEHKTQQFEKAYADYQSMIEQTQAEKANLINLVNLKHNESLQYHNEIQRLNQIILEQTAEHKRVIEERGIMLQNSTSNCSNCEILLTSVREKDEIISVLNQNISDVEKLKTDLNNANEAIKNLTKQCEDLDKSLKIQLETVKNVTAENAQLVEKEHNSSKELERLRLHLMEMEENYTQELMTSEQKLSECQVRLHQVEEKAKQTSTVYTSNSIRANQEVETLRNQIKLLEKQREEVQARFSEAEDVRSRSEAALTNLQVVLEQFQLEKERDIAAATEKIRNKLVETRHHNSKLQDEIAKLNAKLEESLAGLKAASRLGDQVETKTAQINDLKEQVRALQTSVSAAEERYHNAISNQQDKVDKNLVKNLVINYVITAGQSSMNKTQVLRVLSTVLDFNQQECERLGLVRSANTTDSLAVEFVKFLQNESKPRGQLPNMMGLGQSRSTTPTSRRSSTMGPNPVFEPGHRRNPSTGSNNLLFQTIESDSQMTQFSQISQMPQMPQMAQMPTESEPRLTSSHMETGVNQTRNNEGAILKHVLKDM